MRIGSYNIEKLGESSPVDKKLMVGGFINSCANEWAVDLIFLCEVHEKMLPIFEKTLPQMFPNYEVYGFPGGKSNGYIVMLKREYGHNLTVCSQGHLSGLNRDLILVEANRVKDYTGYVMLAHFKSGRTNLTKKQIKDCLVLNWSWVLTGDLNYDYASRSKLLPNGVYAYECWQGNQTHKSGSILDWVISTMDVVVEPFNLPRYAFDMTGPDHLPIVFDVVGGML